LSDVGLLLFTPLSLAAQGDGAAQGALAEEAKPVGAVTDERKSVDFRLSCLSADS